MHTHTHSPQPHAHTFTHISKWPVRITSCISWVYDCNASCSVIDSFLRMFVKCTNKYKYARSLFLQKCFKWSGIKTCKHKANAAEIGRAFQNIFLLRLHTIMFRIYYPACLWNALMNEKMHRFLCLQKCFQWPIIKTWKHNKYVWKFKSSSKYIFTLTTRSYLVNALSFFMEMWNHFANKHAQTRNTLKMMQHTWRFTCENQNRST